MFHFTMSESVVEDDDDDDDEDEDTCFGGCLVGDFSDRNGFVALDFGL